MTPEAALKILENATALLNLPRKEHLVILDALKVLSDTLTAKK